MKIQKYILILLIVLSPLARGAVVLSNLSDTPAATTFVGSDSWVAQSFITGASTQGYLLDSISLSLAAPNSAPSGFEVSIYSNNGGQPGSSVQTLVGSSNPGSGITLYTSASSLTLSPSTTYWIVTSADTSVASDNYYKWQYTNDSAIASTNGFSVNLASGTWALSDNSGSSWEIGSGAPQMFSVSATVVPEPGSLCLLMAGLLLLAAKQRQILARLFQGRLASINRDEEIGNPRRTRVEKAKR